MNNRQKNNKELLAILNELVDNFPDQRFSQILQNYGFVKQTRPAKPDTFDVNWLNEYYSEPEYVLERVKRKMSDYNN